MIDQESLESRLKIAEDNLGQGHSVGFVKLTTVELRKLIEKIAHLLNVIAADEKTHNSETASYLKHVEEKDDEIDRLKAELERLTGPQEDEGPYEGSPLQRIDSLEAENAKLTEIISSRTEAELKLYAQIVRLGDEKEKLRAEVERGNALLIECGSVLAVRLVELQSQIDEQMGKENPVTADYLRNRLKRTEKVAGDIRAHLAGEVTAPKKSDHDLAVSFVKKLLSGPISESTQKAIDSLAAERNIPIESLLRRCGHLAGEGETKYLPCLCVGHREGPLSHDPGCPWSEQKEERE